MQPAGRPDFVPALYAPYHQKYQATRDLARARQTYGEYGDRVAEWAAVRKLHAPELVEALPISPWRQHLKELPAPEQEPEPEDSEHTAKVRPGKRAR